MSHIAFDLDALPLVPKVARSAGLGESVVGWGLTQMWEWCWREKTDRVTTNHLRGFFGHELGAVLVDFGFLEAVGVGLWRVRGAARYLRIVAAQVEAGKKHAGNLKRGTKRAPGTPGEHSPAHPRVVPGSSPGIAGGDPGRIPGSTATSDKRQATSDKRQAKETAPLSRTRVVSDRMCASFFELRPEQGKYVFHDAKDGAALARLLKACDSDDEIDRRWRLGLVAIGWTRISTVAQLGSKWNDIGADETFRRDKPTKYTEGNANAVFAATARGDPQGSF